MSSPLQRGVRLLRRLRPPVRTLALSRPTAVGHTALEFPSSTIRDVLVQPGKKKFPFDIRPIRGRIAQSNERSQTAHPGAAYAWSQATCCATLGG